MTLFKFIFNFRIRDFAKKIAIRCKKVNKYNKLINKLKY